MRVAAAALAGLLIAAACGGDDDAPPATPTAPAAASPTAAQTPAPSGTAPPAGTPVPGGYIAAPVFPNVDFSRMVGLHFIPGDPGFALVLTQMEGVIRRFNIANPDEPPTVFLDLSGALIENPRNEEGLLGFAFAPDFETSGRFFVQYTAGEPRRNVIARYTAAGDAADPASATVVLEIEQPAANHNGGALAFGSDGMLYVALGDGGNSGDPHGNGQSLDTLLGKVLRIDVSGASYEVPPDNPFVGRGRGEIWAYGLRNPWRITFDRETGDLWAGDVGQDSWEEVNRIVRGGNYGWSITEGPDCFRDDACDRDELIGPRAYYPTGEGCAVTGGYVYRGRSMPELRGWYVYGDYCSGRVYALDAASASSEPITLIESGDQITSFAEDFEGELYLVTFGDQIYKLDRPN